MELAYFTCFFGGDNNYSNMIPSVPSTTPSTAPCYFFTNNRAVYDRLESTGFRRIFVDSIPIYNDPIKDSESAKELRACPHHFPVLAPYKYLCWHDSKLNLFEEKVLSAKRILARTEKSFALTKHAYSARFSSVWDEYNLCIGVEKYGKQKEQYKAYIEKKLAAGFSEHIDIHYCVGFMLIKQGPLARLIGEYWYANIKECGIEDQISFDFVNQKYGEFIHPLEYQETWKYCFE